MRLGEILGDLLALFTMHARLMVETGCGGSGAWNNVDLYFLNRILS